MSPAQRVVVIAKVLLQRQDPVPVDLISTIVEAGVDYRVLEARYSV